MSDGPRLGFLGAGQMATALARGWLRAGHTAPERVLATDPVPEARARFSAETGARATTDLAEVVSSSDLLILAVKPQNLPVLLRDLTPLLSPRHLLVSIVA